MDIWVLIETHEDRFDNPDKPVMSEITDILRNEENYRIVDFVRDSDVTVNLVKTD